MKRLKLPILIEDKSLPEKMSQKEFENMLKKDIYKFRPRIYLPVKELYVTCSIDISEEGYFIYAYIYNAENYLDYAIVTTDIYYFKTYSQWKKALKDLSEELIKNWEEWVANLYETV